MVDLLPGIKMRSASLFIGSPGSTILKFTPDSFFKGSKSSKLAIRDSLGTEIFNCCLIEAGSPFKLTASSAGSFLAF